MSKKEALRAAEMFSMRSEGKTYREIGEHYGISKQRAEQIIKKYKNKGYWANKKRRDDFNMNSIVFQGIYDYFYNNINITYAEFTRKVYGRYSTKAERDYIRRLCRGENVRLSIKTTKKICEIIGKPFEEVFERRNTNA